MHLQMHTINVYIISSSNKHAYRLLLFTLKQRYKHTQKEIHDKKSCLLFFYFGQELLKNSFSETPHTAEVDNFNKKNDIASFTVHNVTDYFYLHFL